MKSDYVRVPEQLAEALRRFPTGLYITWYPLLGQRSGVDADEGTTLRETLLGLYGGNRCAVELRTAGSPAVPGNETNTTPRMYGSGLVIYNPPWTLREALEESLPFLAALLGDGQESWEIW
jgi:23S rRNA (adenine2030-N6)-methyltransferase